MSDLRTRTQEIATEYWAARETQSERVAVTQLAIALARAEAAARPTPALAGEIDVERLARAADDYVDGEGLIAAEHIPAIAAEYAASAPTAGESR